MTNKTKNDTLLLKEGIETMIRKPQKSREELKEFSNSEKIFTVKELRDYLNLSQVNFGKKYNIPMRTIQSWEAGVRECPDYVIALLNKVVKYELKDDLRYGRI